MKLSEAILKGCEITEPWKGSYGLRNDSKVTVTCTCAMGAAAAGEVGTKLEDWDNLILNIYFHWPELHTIVVHPVTGYRAELAGTIYNLNDHHEWSREKIADWLAEQGY